MNLEFGDPVLLVEDTPSLSMVYQAALEKAGLNVLSVFRAREAMNTFRERQSKIVLLDLMLPDGDGLDVLRDIHELAPNTRVIVITANGSINRAVEAMRGGAFDFLVKPFDDRKLLSAVQNAVKSIELDADSAILGGKQPEKTNGIRGFVGSSEQMQRIYRIIRNIGRSTATVFITGESGTGKEIAAQAIHDQSIRRTGPFVPINCGAIPRDLLESEVFGHLKGSFTGAISEKIGAAAAADGGTLFLDEICEMDLTLQTKLLRFLQTSMIQPVGAVEARKVDVRIVCATNRNPAAEVSAGRFREDLYYRLHVVPIDMPPLRDRGNDVIEIAEMLLARFAREEKRSFTRFAPDVLKRLRAYSWPGNVRQLENVLRNAIVLNDAEEVTAEMLSASIGPSIAPALLPEHNDQVHHLNGNGHAHGAANGNGHYTNGNGSHAAFNGLGDEETAPAEKLRDLVGSTLAAVEREFIEVTIRECDGSIPRAARMLDVSPSTLYRKREAWHRPAS